MGKLNQSGAMLFSVGNYDLLRNFIPVAFSASVTLPTLSYFVSLSNIFSHCFHPLRFPLIIPVVTRCSSFSLLIAWPKKIAWHLRILFISDLLIVTLFHLSSLQSIVIGVSQVVYIVPCYLNS